MPCSCFKFKNAFSLVGYNYQKNKKSHKTYEKSTAQIWHKTRWTFIHCTVLPLPPTDQALYLKYWPLPSSTLTHHILHPTLVQCGEVPAPYLSISDLPAANQRVDWWHRLGGLSIYDWFDIWQHVISISTMFRVLLVLLLLHQILPRPTHQLGAIGPL